MIGWLEEWMVQMDGGPFKDLLDASLDCVISQTQSLPPSSSQYTDDETTAVIQLEDRP